MTDIANINHPDSPNIRTVARNKSNSTADTTPPTWTLIKIGWNSNIPADDSIHNPNTTPNPVDESKISQHPFITKLSSFISAASKTHNSPIAITTSKSNCIFQPTDLHPYWSVNSCALFKWA